MARPKRQDENPATERVMAPETAVSAPPVYIAPQPRQMVVEREGGMTSPQSRRFPQVRGGVCEYCGILDKNVPSQFQYKLCPHFRGLQLACSYCPANLDPDDVIYHEVLNIAEHPDKPGKIIAWCGKFECSKKHLERFQLATS